MGYSTTNIKNIVGFQRPRRILMDISNRKSLLMALNKSAQQRESAKEIARQVREPFRVMTPEDRANRLRGIRDSMNAPGRMTYSAEQKRLLASYKDLFDNWDNYKEYVNKPMQDVGDWLVEKTIAPAWEAVSSLTRGAKDAGVEGASTPDRASAIKELERSGSSINNLSKNGVIPDLRSFEKTYSALNNNQFNKIASGEVITEDISSAFGRELESSFEIFHQKFAKEYGSNLNLEVDTYNKLYDLAIAHHILTKEGQLKDARTIDNFVKENPSLWGHTKEAGWIDDAWSATKNTVSKGITYMGRAVAGAAKAVGKAAIAVGKGFMKGIKYLVSKLPFLGVLFSLPFMIKNLIEAYHNGLRIVKDLDLPKFGFNRMECLSATGLPHVRKVFNSSVIKFRDDPDSLKELITIFRTIGAFWIDVLYSVTNGFMFILDAIAIAGLFFPGVGWLVSAGAMGASFLLGIGVTGLEIGAEYFKDSYWDKDAAFMLEESKKAVQELIARGTPAEETPQFEIVEDDLEKAERLREEELSRNPIEIQRPPNPIKSPIALPAF
jgi:hypothetical protein